MSPRPVITIRSPCEAWCKRNYRGRSPDSQVVAIPATFPLPKEQWLILAGPLAAHSGATARDSHPLPFSPAAHGEHLGIASIDTTDRTEASNCASGCEKSECGYLSEDKTQRARLPKEKQIVFSPFRLAPANEQLWIALEPIPLARGPSI